MPGHTQTLSVHFLRRTARRRERKLTAELAANAETYSFYPWLESIGAPDWTRGFRVERAGPAYVVVATEAKGH